MQKLPIVILHGWNLSSEKFKTLQGEFIKRGYKVLCFDLPGFGKEEKPDKPLNLTDYVSFVVRELNSRKVDKVVLIGHSFGGRVGIKLAVRKPKLLHALVLTGTPGINPVPKAKIAFFIYLAKMGNVFFSFPFFSIFKNKARQILYRVARATDFYNTDKRMRETFKNIIKEDLKSHLEEMTLPTLLLWGKEDMLVPVKIAKDMFKLLHNAKLTVIPYARHGLPWTHTKQFADKVEEFLKQI